MHKLILYHGHLKVHFLNSLGHRGDILYHGNLKVNFLNSFGHCGDISITRSQDCSPDLC